MVAEPIAGWFFPGRGQAGGPSEVRPPRPAPSNPGKNKRAALGLKGRRSSFPNRPGFLPGFYRRFAKCNLQTTSGFILRNSALWRPSRSAALPGLWAFPCPQPSISWSGSCLPLWTRQKSVSCAKTKPNVKSAPFTTSQRNSNKTY